MSAAAKKAPLWREQKYLLSFMRSSAHARFCGFRLNVGVSVGGHTLAFVERKHHDGTGEIRTVAERTWPTGDPDTVRYAREWCEHVAAKEGAK